MRHVGIVPGGSANRAIRGLIVRIRSNAAPVRIAAGAMPGSGYAV